MLKKISSLVVILLMISCQSISKFPGTKDQQNAYTILAKEKLGDDVIYTPNKSQSYVLCVKETKGNNRQPSSIIKFFVYDLEEAKIIYEENLSAGYVKWYNDNQIEMYSTPGVMVEGTTRNDYTTIYNVISRKSVKKSSL